MAKKKGYSATSVMDALAGSPDEAVQQSATEIVQIEEKKLDDAVESILATVTPDVDVHEFTHEDCPNDDSPVVKRPNKTDPDWHDFVMSEFTQEELVEGSPTVDGLYRVAQKLVGEVVEYRPTVVQGPSPANNMTAVVEAVFEFESVVIGVGDYNRRYRFGGVGEVNPSNTDPEFGRYAASFAETRAKARALRQALGLRKTVAFEEKTTVPVEDSSINGTVTDSQITVMETLCDRLDVNVKKLVGLIADESRFEVKSIRLLPSYIAAKAISRLSEYQRDKGKIDPSVKVFDAKWRG